MNVCTSYPQTESETACSTADAKVFAGEVGQQQKLLPIIFKRLTQDK
jgi:hypothetical protein